MNDGLTWALASIQIDGASGGECHEWQCMEYPRLTRQRQRQNRDSEWIETWHVDGLLNYYHSVSAALDAMKAN